MSHAYPLTGTTVPASILLPDDGDAENAASVNVPLQGLADAASVLLSRTASIADLTTLAAITTPADGLVRHVLGQGLFTFKTSATTGISPFRVAANDGTVGGWVADHAHQTSRVTRMGPGCMAPCLIESGAIAPALITPNFGPLTVTDISLFRNSVQFNTVVTASSTALAVSFGLDPYLIDGATLTLLRLYMVNLNAHAALPALMPKFGILRTAFDQTTATLLSTGSGLAADTSATTAAYQALHWSSFTPDQNNVIDKTQYSYSLQFWNEGGANALIQLLATCIELTQTIPDGRRS